MPIAEDTTRLTAFGQLAVNLGIYCRLWHMFVAKCKCNISLARSLNQKKVYLFDQIPTLLLLTKEKSCTGAYALQLHSFSFYLHGQTFYVVSLFSSLAYFEATSEKPA